MITSFLLTSPTTQSAAPFTVGQPFRQGDVPSGAELVSEFPEFQATVKNRWPDGSMKFAILSGRTSLTANVAKAVKLYTGTPAIAAALTLADLKATGITASISAGVFGSAAWSSTAWDTPDRAWVSGPQMSSWLFRKQIGTDAHLVGWLEVRLYTGGVVEVLPWIENGYLRVAGPTSKNATYSFTLNGSQRFSAAFDLPHHCRTPLVSGTAFTYWTGADPAVTPRHNKAYLQQTRLTPTYSVTVPDASLWGWVAQAYSPLQLSNFPDSMGAGGADPSIGLLPLWDVLYAISADDRAWAGIHVNGYSAGRYSTHYRDETTQRPIRFSSYPNLCVGKSSGGGAVGDSSTNDYTPGPSGTAVPTWTSSHHPSVGYFPYLMTGRCYFLEELQFTAATAYLLNSDFYRQYSKGLFLSNVGANQVRGAAWSLRTLAQAAAATPDGDALHGEFVASLEANIDYYHGKFVAQANNPFGFVAPYVDYSGAGDNILFISPWQQDYFTSAVGYMLDMKPAISAAANTKLDAFFAWKAKSIIGRLGGTASTEFLYCDAMPYQIAAAPSDSVDFNGGTGPWYANWGAIYTATYGTPNPGVEGGLRGSYFPGAGSYWGWLHVPIAYAVTHGVAGAAEAHARLVGASNYSEMNFAADPQWSVVPNVQTSVPAGRSIRVDTTSLLAGALVVGNRGLGVLGSAVPVSGSTGPGYLYNDLSLPADANREVRGVIETWPAAGTLTPQEDSRFLYTGAAGVNTFVYRLYVEGVDSGIATVTLAASTSTFAIAPSLSSTTALGAAAVVVGALVAEVSGSAATTALGVTTQTGRGNVVLSGMPVAAELGAVKTTFSTLAPSVSAVGSAGGADVVLGIAAGVEPFLPAVGMVGVPTIVAQRVADVFLGDRPMASCVTAVEPVVVIARGWAQVDDTAAAAWATPEASSGGTWSTITNTR